MSTLVHGTGLVNACDVSTDSSRDRVFFILMSESVAMVLSQNPSSRIYKAMSSHTVASLCCLNLERFYPQA